MVDKTRKIFCDIVLGRPVRVCSYTRQLEEEHAAAMSVVADRGNIIAQIEDDKEAFEHAVADEMLRNERAEAENKRLLELAAQLEAYCDKLADGLPDGMLPKDIEILRKANADMAAQIAKLEGDLKTYSDAVAGAQVFAIDVQAENEQLRAKIAGVDCGECGESMMDCECDFDALAKELDGE